MSILALIVMSSPFAAAERAAAEAPENRIAIPDFAPDAATSWAFDQTVEDLLPPPSGPGPITFDPAHPYIAKSDF
jgi:hypothetical protein